MPRPDPRAQQLIRDLAQRHAVSEDAVMSLFRALSATGGASAQFNHPELGGFGQWMQGGMSQVGDMFNSTLRAKVDSLCSALSGFVAEHAADVLPASAARQSQSQYQSSPPRGDKKGVDAGYTPGWAGDLGAWWPDELGTPSASGAQNDMRYAYFPSKRRLAMEVGGSLTLFDTLDYEISGVSQQQDASSSIQFSSQKGPIDSSRLPVVSGGEVRKRDDAASSAAGSLSAATVAGATEDRAEPDAFAKIERLHELKQKGILTEEEFAARKKNLLDRL
jgi:hypothetical protein